MITASVEFQERAAIREYLGGYPRHEAERLAVQDMAAQRARMPEAGFDVAKGRQGVGNESKRDTGAIRR